MSALSLRRCAGFAALWLLLTGCSSDNSAESGFSAADVNFAEMMIPHHEQAIEMSELALMNSQDSDVRELAEKIRDAQAPEIELMSSWPGVDPGMHSGHMMEGMLSDDEIQSLRDSTGPAFDRLFLEGMIKHHEGAVAMAEDVIDSDNADVRGLAEEIISTQRREIERMRDLLADL